MTEVDVAIIGAGAAGLAAATVLAGTRLTCVVLEARDRVGGRAHTTVVDGLPLDLGCEWLHSADRNPLVAPIAALGLTIDKTPPPWLNPADTAVFSAAERQAYGQAFAAFDERLETATEALTTDAPASSLLEPGGRWNPLLNAFSAYYNGAEFDQVSILDYAAYDDSEVNWRVTEGYGEAIRRLAPAIRIAYDCPVSLLRYDGPRLALEMRQGTLRARAAILCVPTTILADGVLRLLPDLPDKQSAAAGLPLGLADKVFLKVDEPEAFPAEAMVSGALDRTATGSYHLRPFGRPVIEAFFGGAHARSLEAQGPDAAAAFAVEELAGIYGTGIRRRLLVLATTAWASDPWARGSYSHALPGHAGDRAILAAPVDGRLFFAGEACSPHAFSTAHGAWETGQRAAREVMAALV